MEIVTKRLKMLKKRSDLRKKTGQKLPHFQPHFNRKNYIIVFSRTIFPNRFFRKISIKKPRN